VSSHRPRVRVGAALSRMGSTLSCVLFAGTLGALAPGCESLGGASRADTPEGPRAPAEGEGLLLFNGRDLSGWRRLSGDPDYDASGELSIRDGAMRIGTGGPMTGAGWEGEFPTDGYEVSLEARRVEGGDFFCGMTFPVGESYATLILGGWGGEIVGLSNVDGFAAADNSTTRLMRFEDGRWYAVRLRVSGGRIRVWLDGEQIIEQPIEGHQFAVWPQQEPARPFGITTWRTTGELRAIRLRRVVEPPPAAAD